jgi:hypothetical protein
MGIDVTKQTEFGEVLSEVGDPKNLLGRLIRAFLSKEESVMLRYVDPYGNTVFNQLQIPVLLEECEHLRKVVQTQEEEQFVEDVIRIVEDTKGKTHIYIKLIGD